jgi:hypothetical protein
MMRGSARTVRGTMDPFRKEGIRRNTAIRRPSHPPCASAIARAFKDGRSRKQVARSFKVTMEQVDATLRKFLR